MKTYITENVSQNKNFEINYFELEEVVSALQNRMNNLFIHPEFDPFKENLRKRFPEQYGSMPKVHNGITYYLYPKGFEVDSLIINVESFLSIVNEYIKAKKKIQFTYQEII